jgi:hypothetical protein
MIIFSDIFSAYRGGFAYHRAGDYLTEVSVDVFAVGYADNENEEDFILDGIYNSVIP